MRKSDLATPSDSYFEAMRRLRLSPPSEETVERMVQIYRAWCRKREAERGLIARLRIPPEDGIEDIKKQVNLTHSTEEDTLLLEFG